MCHLLRDRALKTRAAMLVLLLIVSARPVAGQVLDITAVSADQTVEWDGIGEEPEFPVSSWRVRNSALPDGVVAVWSVRQFTNTEVSDAVIDVRLGLSLRNASPRRAWTIIRQVDYTETNAGKTHCEVIAAAGRRGHADFDLMVAPARVSQRLPVSGDYQTVVIGTLSRP